ncbi:MAG: hypothetical protein IIT80_00870 [Aeriscardovia sp.]|nr:hypothetical protein [Aeriscardovia sp.]
MNKSMRQLFIAVLVLFLIITCSTFFWSIIYAPTLDANPENTAAFYHEVGMARGEILSAGGEILALSQKSDDSFNYQRSYPQGEAFAPVTGFFSIAAPPSQGVEMSYDKVLTGGNGGIWQQKFESIFEGQEEGEVNVETNIQAPLQEYSYSLLKGKTGAIVVLDAKTGAILTLASSPTYNPNLLATHNSQQARSLYSSYSQEGFLTDLATQYLINPGSTFNILTSSLALQKGVKPTDEVSAPSTFKLPSGMVIANSIYYPGYSMQSKMDLSTAFSYSSSTAFAILAQKFGAQALEKEAASFGFGSPIHICGEKGSGQAMLSSASSLGNVSDAQDLALSGAGEGGEKVSLIQEAMMVGAVADGGRIMKPELVKRTLSAGLQVISSPSPSRLSSPLTSSQAAEIQAMMENLTKVQDPSLGPVASVMAQVKDPSQADRSDSLAAGFSTSNPGTVVAVMLQNSTSAQAASIMGSVIKEAEK